jgi:hypothetical protein
MGGGGGGQPHVPEFHNKLANFCLLSAWFWIMYQAKENKGQIFGLYAPWEHPHEHGPHLHYEKESAQAAPILAEAEDDDE